MARLAPRPAGMHILMIAPEPFFEPRGTPFSEYHRIRALTSLGHTVDLATYPFGRDVEMRGLRIFRSLRPPFVRHIGIGPSWTKVPLNLLLTLTACRLALTGRYDAVHSHEEGGGIGVILARLLRVPHLYDMHSSLPQQVTNFGYRKMPGLAWILGRLERAMIRGSRVVIVICADLETTVREIRSDVPTVLIENAPGSGDGPVTGSGMAIREALGLGPSTPVALYTGTFEHYQGLDLLYAAMARVKARRPDARLVLVGGDGAQVAHARRQIDALGLTNEVILTGQRPAEEIPAYLDAATVLVSPRSTGTNTPLKIYQYLRSGRAIVATNLRTHTQVLSDEFAILAAPTPEAFGDAIARAFEDPALADTIGARAKAIAETRYSDEAYIAKTKQACALLAGGSSATQTQETADCPATPGLLSSDHYSYAHYANRDVAEGFDALRFSGPIGRHLQQTQEALLFDVLAPLEGRQVLDVGAGTGRAALALASKGAVVHGLDASAEMLDVARERAAKAGLTIAFDVADAHALPVADRSVDAAVCFRLLMHVIDWPTCVAELCRVSRHRVVIDFPAALSAAAVESFVRRRRQAAGQKVEAYRVLREADVRRVFAAHGFRVVMVRRQFVLPIALHKAIDRLPISLGIERALAAVGLLRLLGSPVTMVAER